MLFLKFYVPLALVGSLAVAQQRQEMVSPLAPNPPSAPAAARAERPVNNPQLTDLDKQREDSFNRPAPDRRIKVDKAMIDRLVREKGYDLMAVINKDEDPANPDAQTMTIYRFVTIEGHRVYIPPVKFPVSTGLEKWSCEKVKDKSGAVVGHAAKWLGTPTGAFKATVLHPDHHSKTYDDADMYKAIFFNGGIAAHQGNLKELDKLGKKRASHGCVRLSPNDSATLFKWVAQTVSDPSHVDTRGICTNQSLRSPADLEQCKAKASERGSKWKRLLNEGLAERAEMEKKFGPTVMRERRAGNADVNSLFIVHCTDRNGQDCSNKSIPPKPSCSASPKAAPAITARKAQPARVAVARPTRQKNFFETLFGL